MDLPTFAFGRGDGVDVELFLSAGTARSLGEVPFRVHGLRSPADLHARLPLPARMAVDAAVWSADHLAGLEDRVRGFDLIHTAEVYAPMVEQSLRLRDAGHVRAVVATVMENIPFFPRSSPVVRRRIERIAGSVDHWLAVTERAKLHLVTNGVPEERVEVLPVGVDTDRFAPLEGTGAPGATPGAPGAAPSGATPGGPLRVVTVSRLEPGKGVEDLAIAAGLLAQRGVELAVTFVGSGPSRPMIEEIGRHYGIADRFAFPGFVPWERLQEVHHAHDVFVLASGPSSNWREQFGYAVVEAMGCGLPILVGDSGSLMEVAGRPESLVTPRDPLSLAAKLEPLARDPALRAELGAWNRRRAVETFDAAHVRARLREVYAEVLERRTTASATRQ